MNNRSNYNPNIHHRRSIRLKGYNYSKAGLYFITICVKDKLELFGEINQKLILNDSGKMIERWYSELENKYPDKRCHEMIVMPNHFHCILENLDADGGVDVNGNVGMVGDVAKYPRNQHKRTGNTIRNSQYKT